MYPNSIQKLIDYFSKLPSVGPRTASKYAFALLKLSKEELKEFAESIKNIKEHTMACSQCYSITDNKDSLCHVCINSRRDKKTICIVEKEADMASIEKLNQYNGTYHVLGGNISVANKQSLDKLRLNELAKRIKSFNSKEVEIIIATNLTTEGDTTALYLERVLKPLNIKITRLGRGLPTGGEMEYADETTLLHALKERRESG